MPTLAMIAAGSFVAARHAVTTGNQNGAFYLLQYRAWELLAGSLLSFMPIVSWASQEHDHRVSFSKLRTWFLACVGLLLVLAPYALLSRNTPFPGTAALPSILGTALLIRYGQTGWINRFLCWRPFIATGKISYSLYLWHWPVIVFWRYVTYDQLVMRDYVGMLTLSLLLGYLSWRFVEMPVRISPTWTMRKSFTFATTGIILFATLSLSCAFQRGWPRILHPRANAFADACIVQQPPFPLRIFQPASSITYHFALGEVKAAPEVFLLGDSHANVLRPGLIKVLQQYHIAGQTVFGAGVDMTDMSSPWSQEAIQELRNHPSISKVILTQMWRFYPENSARWERLLKFALCIKEMGKTLYICADVPQTDKRVEMMMPRVAIIKPRRMEVGWDGHYPKEYYDQQQGGINQQIQAICDKTGAVLIPLYLALKQEDGSYSAFEIRNGKPVPLYFDGDHLGWDGCLKAGKILAPYIFPERPTAGVFTAEKMENYRR